MKYYQIAMPNAAQVNAGIWQQFQDIRDNPELKRSHYFEGRYENVYVNKEKIPVLIPVLEAALQVAADQLGLSAEDLAVGFWFNEMMPGHVTLPHIHSDDDELLSGVYYVRVPPNSGNLQLGENRDGLEITPLEGQFVFFGPEVLHAVGKNLSDSVRLSIGMNFGRRTGR